MQTSSVAYEADGREMVGTLVVPDGSDARPAVLVAHEGGGLDDHARTIARRLAELGYVAFALDYYGGGKRLPDREAINERLMGIIGDADRIRASTSRPEDASNITAKVLVCIGAEDPLISPEERAAFEAEMRAGGVDWRMNLYGGAVHSFTNPDAHLAGFAGIAYDEPTAARSWRAMLDLFDETLS